MNSLRVAFSALAIILTSLAHAATKSVVLVHGAFADGSGWKPVADTLKRDGYTVYVVQEPETTFEADLAVTRVVLGRSGPCVLVRHHQSDILRDRHPRFLTASRSPASHLARMSDPKERLQ